MHRKEESVHLHAIVQTATLREGRGPSTKVAVALEGQHIISTGPYNVPFQLHSQLCPLRGSPRLEVHRKD